MHYIETLRSHLNPQHWLVHGQYCLVFLFLGQISQDVSSTRETFMYILSFIRNDLDLPRKLINIIIALDAAHVRFDV